MRLVRTKNETTFDVDTPNGQIVASHWRKDFSGFFFFLTSCSATEASERASWPAHQRNETSFDQRHKNSAKLEL